MKKISQSQANEKKLLFKKFNEGLENALRKEIGENLKLISCNLLDLFEQLVIVYVETNDWTNLFELIDKIELFFKKNSSEKSQILRQSEYYHYLGNVFFKIEKEIYALNFYRRALKISNDSNLLAMESYENLINSLIDRWHYRMINDRIRNEAYRKAIKKKLSNFNENPSAGICNVLDIGGGFGLLSAISLAEALEIFQSPEKIHILCCDMNEIMNEISRKFLESFNLPKSVKILNKHSNDLDIAEDFDNQPIQLVITEIFDDGLLGEGCLDTFYNALVVNKLINRKTSVVPISATIYLCGLESEYLRKMTKFSEVFSYGDKFKIVNGFCLENSMEFANNLAKDNIEFLYEPYTTENIRTIPFSQLTNRIKLEELSIKFNDPIFLEKYCKHNEITTLEKKLKALKNGRLDAYLIYFDLNLDDEITLTNSPFFSDESNSLKYTSNCWHHALFTIQEEKIVTLNQEISLRISFSKECVLVNHLLEKDETKSEDANLTLTRDEIGFLNNNEYQNFYSNWLTELYEKFPSNQTNLKKHIRFGYLSNTFNKSLFALIYEYRGRFKKEKNIDLFIEIFVNDQEENYDGFVLNFRNNFSSGFEFVKIKSLYENSEKAKFEFNLNFLICELLDFKLGTLRKNILTDLIFIKSNNLDKGIFI